MRAQLRSRGAPPGRRVAHERSAMRGKFLRLWAMLALLAGVLAVPGPTVAATDPGVSVAAQAGAPGTQFEVIGAGWVPHSSVSVLVERDHQAGRTIETS